MRPINIQPGEKFGRLEAKERVASDSAGRSQWRCVCECGTEKTVTAYYLKTGHTRSCGCLVPEISAAIGRARATHGQTGSRAYRAWRSMLDRCYRPTSANYERYGAKGVRVCDEWRTSFAAFFAELGECPPGHTLDRLKERDYQPGNCRWATPTEQANNRSTNVWATIGGETLTLSQWADRTGIPRGTIKVRWHNGFRGEALIGPRYARNPR